MKTTKSEVEKKPEAQNFTEQQELVQKIKADSKTSMDEYINRKLSVNDRVLQAM